MAFYRNDGNVFNGFYAGVPIRPHYSRVEPRVNPPNGMLRTRLEGDMDPFTGPYHPQIESRNNFIIGQYRPQVETDINGTIRQHHPHVEPAVDARIRQYRSQIEPRLVDSTRNNQVQIETSFDSHFRHHHAQMQANFNRFIDQYPSHIESSINLPANNPRPQAQAIINSGGQAVLRSQNAERLPLPTNLPHAYGLTSLDTSLTRNQLTLAAAIRDWRAIENDQAASSSSASSNTQPHTPQPMTRREQLLKAQTWRFPKSDTLKLGPYKREDPELRSPSLSISDLDILELRISEPKIAKQESSLPYRPAFSALPPQTQAAQKALEQGRVIKPKSPREIAEEVSNLQRQILAHNASALSEYVPSHTVAFRDNTWQPQFQLPNGKIHNYRGDLRLAEERERHCDENENCALWVLNLPANVTYHTLLASIRNVGNLFAVVINRADDEHKFAASKLTFFKRADAELLKNRANAGDWWVMNRQIRNVRWNLKRSAPKIHSRVIRNSMTNEKELIEFSRVIRITGETHRMNQSYFENLFSSKCRYEIDHIVLDAPCPFKGKSTQIWHFASFRMQAGAAFETLYRELRTIFEVEFLPDPCAGP